MGLDVIWCQRNTENDMNICALVEAGIVIHFIEINYSQVRQTLSAVHYEISLISNRYMQSKVFRRCDSDTPTVGELAKPLHLFCPR
jgi:hypothetical protein